MKATRPNLVPSLFLTLLTVLVLVVYFFAEQWWGWTYFTTTALKVSLLVLLIIGYRRWISLSGRRRPQPLITAETALPLKGLALGILFAAVLTITYITIGSLVDFGSIKQELINESGINLLNYVFIGLYITIINSFLEEYFFRGFLVHSYRDLGYPKVGVHFSALVFSLYHLGIFVRWFEWPILLLALVILYFTALLLTFINLPSRRITNSWIAHLIVNSAILLIGADAFGWLTLNF